MPKYVTQKEYDKLLEEFEEYYKDEKEFITYKDLTLRDIFDHFFNLRIKGRKHVSKRTK